MNLIPLHFIGFIDEGVKNKRYINTVLYENPPSLEGFFIGETMLLFNPFRLRKHLQEYIGKYAKQARVIVHLKGNLAKLSSENDRLWRENHQLKQKIKEKDSRIVALNELLTKQVDLAKTIEFNRLPRKERREMLRNRK